MRQAEHHGVAAVVPQPLRGTLQLLMTAARHGSSGSPRDIRSGQTPSSRRRLPQVLHSGHVPVLPPMSRAALLPLHVLSVRRLGRSDVAPAVRGGQLAVRLRPTRAQVTNWSRPEPEVSPPRRHRRQHSRTGSSSGGSSLRHCRRQAQCRAVARSPDSSALGTGNRTTPSFGEIRLASTRSAASRARGSPPFHVKRRAQRSLGRARGMDAIAAARRTTSRTGHAPTSQSSARVSE